MPLTKKTALKIPNYKRSIEFGLIYKFSYPLDGSGKLILKV